MPSPFDTFNAFSFSVIISLYQLKYSSKLESLSSAFSEIELGIGGIKTLSKFRFSSMIRLSSTITSAISPAIAIFLFVLISSIILSDGKLIFNSPISAISSISTLLSAASNSFFTNSLLEESFTSTFIHSEFKSVAYVFILQHITTKRNKNKLIINVYVLFLYFFFIINFSYSYGQNFICYYRVFYNKYYSSRVLGAFLRQLFFHDP